MKLHPEHYVYEKDDRCNLGRFNLFKSAPAIATDEANGRRPKWDIDISDGNKGLINGKRADLSRFSIALSGNSERVPRMLNGKSGPKRHKSTMGVNEMLIRESRILIKTHLLETPEPNKCLTPTSAPCNIHFLAIAHRGATLYDSWATNAVTVGFESSQSVIGVVEVAFADACAWLKLDSREVREETDKRNNP